MHKQVLSRWGKPVNALWVQTGITSALYTSTVFAARQGVYKLGGLYEPLPRFLPGVFHSYLRVFTDQFSELYQSSTQPITISTKFIYK